MRALEAALNTIDAVATEGDLAPDRPASDPLELEAVGERIVLPDGKRIYPPRLHGQPIDELACAPRPDGRRAPRRPVLRVRRDAARPVLG